MDNQYLHPSYFRSIAEGTHQQFVETLKSYKDQDSEVGRQFCFEELQRLHDDASLLLTDYGDRLTGQCINLLTHIANRSTTEHIQIQQTTDKNIISTF